MKSFDVFLKNLVKHEQTKQFGQLSDREKMIVLAGIGLNWQGDFLGNPAFNWQLKTLPIERIQFSGTSPEWNEILLNQCRGMVEEFRELVRNKPALLQKFDRAKHDARNPIMVRHASEQREYKVLDGMHRFVGAVLAGKKTVKAWLPVNERQHRPVCEPHVIYDLIRGYLRNANDEEGRLQLYYGLKLFARSYENVIALLQTRFDISHVRHEDVQQIIKKVIQETE